MLRRFVALLALCCCCAGAPRVATAAASSRQPPPPPAGAAAAAAVHTARAVGVAPPADADSDRRRRRRRRRRQQGAACPEDAAEHFAAGTPGRVFEWFTADKFRIGEQLAPATLAECAAACLAAVDDGCRAFQYKPHASKPMCELSRASSSMQFYSNAKWVVYDRDLFCSGADDATESTAAPVTSTQPSALRPPRAAPSAWPLPRRCPAAAPGMQGTCMQTTARVCVRVRVRVCTFPAPTLLTWLALARPAYRPDHNNHGGCHDDHGGRGRDSAACRRPAVRARPPRPLSHGKVRTSVRVVCGRQLPHRGSDRRRQRQRVRTPPHHRPALPPLSCSAPLLLLMRAPGLAAPAAASPSAVLARCHACKVACMRACMYYFSHAHAAVPRRRPPFPHAVCKCGSCARECIMQGNKCRAFHVKAGKDLCELSLLSTAEQFYAHSA